MGAMKELRYHAEQICDNCFRAPANRKELKSCGKCVINVLTTDSKGEQITVLLKGQNKEIIRVDKECQKCGRKLTDRAVANGESICRTCERKENKEKLNASETVGAMDTSK